MTPYHQPFAEQLEFFRAKTNLPTERWDDIREAEHDRAFIVAGAQAADLLDDLNAAVLKAIEQGTGLEAFRKDFKALVAKHGWTGWTGEGSKQGIAWRTKVIYQTNLATSYAAGRYRQLTDPDLRAILPYWRYKHADGVLHPRPLHVAWDGLTLPPEHEFWQAHFPPNGWGCHCRVTAVAKNDYLRAVANGRGPANAPPAGATAGIDRGFAYTPGASVADELRALVDAKLPRLPAPIADALAADAARIEEPTPRTLDDFIAAGRKIVDSLPSAADNPRAFHATLLARLDSEVGIATPCAVASRGEAADLVRAASRLFPDTWTAAADRHGPLFTRLKSGARAFCQSYDYQQTYRVRVPGFGPTNVPPGAGYILLGSADAIDVAVHELAHRLQAALPDLDDIYQQLHDRRTQGAAPKRLRTITGNPGYRTDEITREDSYFDPYQGKAYNTRKGERALEMITMAMQAILGAAMPRASGFSPVEMLAKLYTTDREMVDLSVGLLFHWRPAP